MDYIDVGDGCWRRNELLVTVLIAIVTIILHSLESKLSNNYPTLYYVAGTNMSTIVTIMKI